MNWEIIRLALDIIERSLCLIENSIPHKKENNFAEEFYAVFLQSFSELVLMTPEEEK
jgi:hypothetical protein